MRNLLYLIGRIRSKENALLSNADWQNFSAMTTLPRWLEQLKETAYAAAAEQGGTFETFEQALNAHLLELKQDLFLANSFPFEPLLWKKYDFHNFKVLLKMKYGFKDLRKYLVPLGEIPVNTLESYLLKNEKVNIPVPLMAFFHKARDIFNQQQDFSAMDTYIDKVYFQDILKLSKGWGKAVEQYFKLQIDLANFKLWWSHKKYPAVPVEYIPGGKFTVERLNKAAALDLEQMLGQYFPKLDPQLKAAAAIQKEIDEELSALLYAKRYLNQGILPVLMFFRAKELEVKNLKIFYLRQAKNLSRLTAHLRKAYA